MENEEKIIFSILSGLPDKWKSFFRLYTQYIGYLTAGMTKTLLEIKRCSYFDYSNINVDIINQKTLEYGLAELPYRGKEELNEVIPVLWEYLDEFDLCEISDESWKGLIDYLDSKIAKEK